MGQCWLDKWWMSIYFTGLFIIVIIFYIYWFVHTMWIATHNPVHLQCVVHGMCFAWQLHAPPAHACSDLHPHDSSLITWTGGGEPVWIPGMNTTPSRTSHPTLLMFAAAAAVGRALLTGAFHIITWRWARFICKAKLGEVGGKALIGGMFDWHLW